MPKLPLRINVLLFIAIAVVVTILGMLSQAYLPERFFYDAYTIALDRYNESGWIGSYPFSMSFYEITGLNSIDFSLVGLIQIPIIFIAISTLGIPKTFSKLTLRNFLAWISLLLIAFFVSYPSKEFINILYLALIAYALTRSTSLTKKMLISSVLFFIFSWFFRPYYLLVPIIAACLYVVNFISIRNKPFSNILTGLVFAIFISLAYGVVKGDFMSSSSRESLNYERLEQKDQNADTMILSPLPTETVVGESISIFYGFLTVNFPVNALKFWYKPQVIVFLLFQIVLFIVLFRVYGKVLKNKAYQHEQWILNLIFAYFILQGVFEPDLGSAIRHKIGVLPILWLAIYYDKNLIGKPARIKKYVFKNV